MTWDLRERMMGAVCELLPTVEVDRRPVHKVTCQIKIRRATRDDAAAIAGLAAQLGYPTGVEEAQTRICAIARSSADFLVVAIDSEKVVGWLQAQSRHLIEIGQRVEIVGLVVDSSARRSGTGRLLVAAAEDWARSIGGTEAIVVRSNVKRVESHAFYPAIGYRLVKTQNVYKKSFIEQTGADE
jgi:GNAT superfamily N-acetyltransferase